MAALPPVRAGVCADPDWMAGFARHIEGLGFESVVVVEHPLVVGGYTSTYPYAASGRMPLPDDCAIPDPIDLLSYLAGVTSTLGLATGVLVLPRPSPCDHGQAPGHGGPAVEGPRCGCRSGWGGCLRSFEACGIDFPSRGRRTDECIDVMRALWADTEPEGATFEGEFFAFAHAHTHPKPVRPEGVPIHIGGHSPPSIRRAARRGDGWQPLGLWGEELAQALARLHTECGRGGAATSMTSS